MCRAINSSLAGDAWEQCRTNSADPSRFGIIFDNIRGLWYVAGNLIRDVAALNKVESLPWDVWGAQPQPDAELSYQQREFFDELAAISRNPDATFDELHTRYVTDERVRVLDTVFNAILQRAEPLVPSPTSR